VDESFADAADELFLALHRAEMGENDMNLRSFGKFLKLAGVREGFVLAGSETSARVLTLAGLWAAG
jgi:histidinol-phosphate/aromatic aminotransferase/cobyric acid decarboxylase-like protein